MLAVVVPYETVTPSCWCGAPTLTVTVVPVTAVIANAVLYAGSEVLG